MKRYINNIQNTFYHKWDYSQRFPWPGYWKKISDPYYRRIYLQDKSQYRDLFVRFYQSVLVFIDFIKKIFDDTTNIPH
jgi:hypothetical protein